MAAVMSSSRYDQQLVAYAKKIMRGVYFSEMRRKLIITGLVLLLVSLAILLLTKNEGDKRPISAARPVSDQLQVTLTPGSSSNWYVRFNAPVQTNKLPPSVTTPEKK
jgi:hypothetical protein